MDFLSIPLFSTMKTKMGYISQRQGVLAQNIANADTPGYKAQDVQQPDFKQMVAHSARSLQLAGTSSKHFTGNAYGATKFAVTNRASTYELNPTGNNVSIEEEMSKLADNQAEYNKVLNLYRKSVDMFKTAIGKPTG